MNVIDTSDEATGLPPLDIPAEADSIWAMVVTSAQADVLSPLDQSPQGCFVLSVRGLVQAADGGVQWGQVHIAVPHGSVRAIEDRAAAYIDQYGDD